VQWHWPRSIPQRSRSQDTLKGLSTHACVRSVTYVRIDGLLSNWVQMLSSLRQCALTSIRIHTSKVKVTHINNLHFLFSHSWPVVVLFGQVQRTSQVERKTKCLQKNDRGYSRPLDCLVLLILMDPTFIKSASFVYFGFPYWLPSRHKWVFTYW